MNFKLGVARELGIQVRIVHGPHEASGALESGAGELQQRLELGELFNGERR